MPRTVSASEAKTHFGSIVDWAVESNEDVVVESYGSPKAVIMSYEEYREVLRLREAARRQKALAQLRQLREEVRARNQDLDEQEARELASEISRKTIQRMAQEGQVTFEE